MAEEYSPRRNRLLASLPAPHYQRLLPHLELVPLRPGCAIHAAGDRESHLHFLAACIVSRIYVMRNGDSAEFALTGNEGVIGVASILGGNSTPSRTVVVSEGYSYRLSAAVARAELEHEGPLAHLLLRCTLALLAQAGQVAACSRHHSLEQRLCRWILANLDRLPSNELAIKQELVAEMLGVRREGISETAARLQRDGLIRCRRGRITVLGRAGLEARACECYAAIKQEYARLLPEAAPPRGVLAFAGYEALPLRRPQHRHRFDRRDAAPAPRP